MNQLEQLKRELYKAVIELTEAVRVVSKYDGGIKTPDNQPMLLNSKEMKTNFERADVKGWLPKHEVKSEKHPVQDFHNKGMPCRLINEGDLRGIEELYDLLKKGEV